MAFPVDPLDVMVELELDGVWTDVTADTYTRNPITITRGRQDEGNQTEPSTCSLTFNNRDGRFSPRNPMSPYYGLIGRNTPLRVSALLGAPRLVSATAVDRFNAPDTAGLSITGDIDLRVDMRIPDWTAGNQLLTKFQAAGQLSYVLDMNTDGTVRILWSTDGTSQLSISSAVPLPQLTGRQAVRATLDVNNGAAGRTATFYTGPTVDGPWTQLGAAVTVAGTTSIFNSTSVLTTCDTAGVETYALKVLDGMGGTERANPDFTAQAEGTTSFADAAGNTWTAINAGVVTARRYRFHGEVSSWPQAWDLSGNDVWVPVQAAGILRRLGQGSDPLKSSIQRFVTRNTNTPYAYWPMDDAEGSTTIASGLSGGPAMTVAGAPEFASDGTFVSSNPVLRLGGAVFTGAVSPMAATGTVYAQMLLSVPTAGEAADGVFLRVFTTGTVARWDVAYVAASDNLRVDAFDATGASLLSVNTSNPNGKPLSLILHLAQNGSNVDWNLYLNGYVDPTAGIGPTGGTLVGRTVGVATAVQINPSGTLTESAVGHLYVFAARLDTTLAEINALRGHVSETAGNRVARLCAEEGIAFTGYGDLDESEPMGAQRPLSLVDLLNECEVADMGQLFESRDRLGLAYRTRSSREIQSVALALDYGDLTELVPVEDDQATRNDVTVSRTGGSSARATVDTGPLSTQAPPNGVGRYAETVDVNLWRDSQCAHQASWRATIGTVDESRYPTIRAQLETSAFAASTALTSSALDVEHGDRITVEGTPAWLPPETIEQHTVGQIETLKPFAYSVDYVCTPAGPTGSVALLNDSETRLDSETTTLAEDLTTTEPDVTIQVEAGSAPWVTTAANPGEFPFDVEVGGEVMTVTACVGATSPQTFTVTRSVNGVVKTHSTGAQVRLARPVYLAL